MSVTCCWVGDSRAILVTPDKRVWELSTDHNLGNEREQSRIEMESSRVRAHRRRALVVWTVPAAPPPVSAPRATTTMVRRNDRTLTSRQNALESGGYRSTFIVQRTDRHGNVGPTALFKVRPLAPPTIDHRHRAPHSHRGRYKHNHHDHNHHRFADRSRGAQRQASR